MNKIESQVKVRLYYLDWLRVLAFGLLVFYHAGLIFVDWGFHIQNKELTDALKPPLLFLNQWRLPLLFLVSGAGTFFALGRRSGVEFMKERFVRLFIPLVFGILFVIPPQVFFERLNQHAFSGSYIQFYPEFFNGIYPHGNFTWNHLWFIVYLLTFVILALPVFMFARNEDGKKIMNSISLTLSKPLRLIVLVVPLLVIEFALRRHWPDTRNLVSDWYNFSFYFVIFLYGYFIASDEKLWPVIEQDRKIYLLLGILSFSIIFFGWHYPGQSFLEKISSGHLIFGFFKCLNILCWILCLLGYSKRYLNFSNTTLQYANKAVYPFYILHQTVLIVIGYYIIKLDSGIAIKYALCVTGTYLITMIFYEFIIRRMSVIKIFFGIK